MLKHLMFAMSLSAIVASGALAQTQPATPSQAQAEPAAPQAQSGEAKDAPDQCLQSAMTLAQSAEQKNLSDAQLDKIEQMLAKMEDHCDAAQFSEAQAMAKDIESAIGQQ